jgi:hypothetical protein
LSESMIDTSREPIATSVPFRHGDRLISRTMPQSGKLIRLFHRTPLQTSGSMGRKEAGG